MDNKKLVMLWRDLSGEMNGKKEVNYFKKLHQHLNTKELIELIEEILLDNDSNLPTRSTIGIYQDDYDPIFENEIIIFLGNVMNYKELLFSFATLLYLANPLDKPYLIVHLVHCLKSFNEKIAEQFRMDIAERVYQNTEYKFVSLLGI